MVDLGTFSTSTDDDDHEVEPVIVIAPRLATGGVVFSGRGGGGRTAVRDNDPSPDSLKETILNNLRESMRDDGDLTEAERRLMAQHQIELSDVLRPGIYQNEWNVVGVGEHRQWVLVPPDGPSRLITAGPGPDGRIQVEIATWESHRHGLNPDGNGTHRFYAVQQTINSPTLASNAWAQMENAARAINTQRWNYNFMEQNSNTVHETVGAAGGIETLTRALPLERTEYSIHRAIMISHEF